MSRPLLLVFLLIVLIITSQVEWKQPLAVDENVVLSGAEKQLRIAERQEAERQESVKEKIILSQERIIHDLRNTVQDVQEQLKQCQSRQESSNATRTSRSVANKVIKIEQVDTTHN